MGQRPVICHGCEHYCKKTCIGLALCIEKKAAERKHCKDCHFFIFHMQRYYPQDWETRLTSVIYFPCHRLNKFKNPMSKMCELFVEAGTLKEPEQDQEHRRLEL